MWFKIEGQQVSIQIIAKPNAKKTKLLAIDESGLHISLHAKPHQGEANEELISFLSALFKIPKKQIQLERGERGKHKRVSLPLNKKIQELLTNPESFISV